MDNNINKQEVLQCRSCNEIFVASDRKIKYIHIFGMVIEEKICPHCGSATYGLVDYPVSEEKLIYRNKPIQNRTSAKEQKRLLMDKCEVRDEQELEFYSNGYQIKSRRDMFSDSVDNFIFSRACVLCEERKQYARR